MDQPKLLGLLESAGIHKEEKQVMGCSAQKSWIALSVGQSQASFNQADTFLEITRIAGVKTHHDQRPAGAMGVSIFAIELEDLEKSHGGSPELPAVRGEGSFQLQQADLEGFIARALLEESASPTQGFPGLMKPVRHTIGVAQFGVGTRLEITDPIGAITPGVELEGDLGGEPGELDHLPRILVAELPAPVEEGLHPREVPRPPGELLRSHRATLLQHSQSLACLGPLAPEMPLVLQGRTDGTPDGRVVGGVLLSRELTLRRLQAQEQPQW